MYFVNYAPDSKFDHFPMNKLSKFQWFFLVTFFYLNKFQVILMKLKKFSMILKQIWIFKEFSIAICFMSLHYSLEDGMQEDVNGLTHWGLVTPYGDSDLGQHWLR